LFLSKFTFIYTKLKLKTCHTRWLSFKNDIGKMTTVFLVAIFKPFLKIVHDTGQQLTIDQTNFLMDGFLQIIQRTGFVSVNTRFQIPPKKKSHGRSDQGGHSTSPKRDMRCPGNMFRTMVIDSFAVCAVAPSCWNHTFAQFILLWRSTGARPTYWVLPIQNMSGSCGSPCISKYKSVLFSFIHLLFNYSMIWKC